MAASQPAHSWNQSSPSERSAGHRHHTTTTTHSHFLTAPGPALQARVLHHWALQRTPPSRASASPEESLSKLPLQWNPKRVSAGGDRRGPLTQGGEQTGNGPPRGLWPSPPGQVAAAAAAASEAVVGKVWWWWWWWCCGDCFAKSLPFCVCEEMIFLDPELKCQLSLQT